MDAIKENDDFDAEEAELSHELYQPPPKPNPPVKQSSKLSVVSRMYDRGGKGYLDDKEKIMRSMDEEGRGHLTNEKVYSMLEEQMKLQKKTVTQRWLIIGLCAFALFLALANMGTAFAAAIMAKDTAVDKSGNGLPHLTDINGNDIATKTLGSTVMVAQNGCVNVHDLANVFNEMGAGSPGVMTLDEGEFKKDVIPLNGAEMAEDMVCFSSDNASKSKMCFSLYQSCGNTQRRLIASDNALKDNFHNLISGGLNRLPEERLNQRRLTGACRNFDCALCITLYKDNNKCDECCASTSSDALSTSGGGNGNSGNGNSGNGNTGNDNGVDKELTPAEIRKFADMLYAETQACDACCPFNEPLEKAFASYGVGEDDAIAGAILKVLEDNSSDAFEDSKMQHNENCGITRYAVCNSGRSNGACKNKGEAIQMVYDKLLTNIAMADEAEIEPDLAATFAEIEETSGLDERTIDWLLHEDEDKENDMKEKLKAANKKATRAFSRQRGLELEEELNIALDQGKDIEDAIEETGLDAYDVNRFLDAIPDDRKPRLDNKIHEPRNNMKEKTEKVYKEKGYLKNESNGKWELSPGHSGGRMSFDDEGNLHFTPGQGQNDKSFKSRAEKIKQNNSANNSANANANSRSRRLATDTMIKKTQGLNKKLTLHVKQVQRRLQSLQDFDEGACPTRYMGCFLDNDLDRDFDVKLGNSYSIVQCSRDCFSQGYSYIGLQAGGHCYCGDEGYGKHGLSSSCNLSCNGGGRCGGSTSNSIYKNFDYPSSGCISEEFNDIGTELGNAVTDVTEKLEPLSTLLETLASGEESLRALKTMSQLIDVAVDVGSNIPYIGPVLKVGKVPVELAKDMIVKASGKVTTYQNKIGDVWERSVGKVFEILEGFSTTLIDPIVATGDAINVMEGNQCVQSIFTGSLPGFLETTETALASILDYSQKLLDALKNLLETLVGSFWTQAESTLQDIMDKIEPMNEFLSPLEPLGDLLETEITLPWFQLPYFETKLGYSRCNSGYYKGTVDKNTCWESNSYYWESIWTWSGPWKMRRTCKSGPYESRTLGGCWNEYYRSHTTGLRWSWWRGPYCDSGYYTMPWYNPWGCTKYCGWGRHMDTGYCYKTSCKSHFWSEATIRCNGNQRNQYYHRGTCNHVSVKSADASKYLWWGECWQGCSSGDRGFAGACFPPAQLKISVEKVADALQTIIEFIEDLPIVNEIKNAIDNVIGALLKPITDYIKGLELPFNIPEFPTLEIDSLPFGVFDDIGIGFPALPDFSQFENLQETVMSSLPLPSNILDCGLNTTCVLAEGGFGELTEMADDFQDILSLFDAPALMERFSSIILNVPCTHWEDITLPVSTLLSLVPALDGAVSACDIDIPMCQNYDFSAATESIDEFKSMVEQIFSNLQSNLRRRKLANGPTKSLLDMAFLILRGLLRIELQWGWSRQFFGKNAAWQTEASAKVLVRKKGTREKEEEVVSSSITIGPAFFIDPIVLDFGNVTVENFWNMSKWKIGFSVGTRFDISISRNKGFIAVLSETILYAEEFNKDPDPLNFWDLCFKNDKYGWDTVYEHNHRMICAIRYLAYSVALNEWAANYFYDLTDELRKDIPSDLKQLIPELELNSGKESLVGNTDRDRCSVDKMKETLQLLEDARKTYGYDYFFGSTEDAWDCIQYWNKVKKAIDRYRKRSKSYEMTGGEELMEFIKGETSFLDNIGKQGVFFGTFAANKLKKGNFTNLRYNTGIVLEHPTKGTSLGPTFFFNKKFQNAFQDIAQIGFLHLPEMLTSLGKVATRESSLRGDIVKGWPIRVYAQVECKFTYYYPILANAPTDPSGAPTSAPLTPLSFVESCLPWTG